MKKSGRGKRIKREKNKNKKEFSYTKEQEVKLSERLGCHA